MNIKRLDDPTIPVASTLVGLIIYGMQGGQTVQVTPTLLEGSDGVDGINGKSAYQVAVDNGFVGTAAQWLDSLIGNSAYEEWVANGGVGTFQDFLDEIVETVNLLIPQTLTEAQKEQVRENINVLSQSVITDELAKKAEHGYAAEETPKTLKEIDDSVSQLAGDVALKADKTQEDWITPTLLNGWVNNGNNEIQYYKDNFGVVRMRGTASGGTFATTVFTLPVGYRPIRNFGVNTSAGIGTNGHVNILSSGVVWFRTGTSNNVDNVTFKAEQ